MIVLIYKIISHKVLFNIETLWYLDIKIYSAVTIVDGWSKAETGVGLSIASGSYTLKIIWADFVIADSINKKLIINIV